VSLSAPERTGLVVGGAKDPHLDDLVNSSMAPMKPPRDSRVPRGRSLEEVVPRLGR
jgi:hypothetical protein